MSGAGKGRVVVVGGGAVGLAFAAACGEEVRVLEAGPGARRRIPRRSTSASSR